MVSYKEGKLVEKKQPEKKQSKIQPNEVSIDLKNKDFNNQKEKKMTTEKTKANALRSDVIADLKDVQKVVKDAVNVAAQNVEKIHKKFISLPPKYFGKIERFEKISKDIKEVQEKTIGHVYDLIKIINDKFNDIAEDILTKSEPKTADKK